MCNLSPTHIDVCRRIWRVLDDRRTYWTYSYRRMAYWQRLGELVYKNGVHTAASIHFLDWEGRGVRKIPPPPKKKERKERKSSTSRQICVFFDITTNLCLLGPLLLGKGWLRGGGGHGHSYPCQCPRGVGTCISSIRGWGWGCVWWWILLAFTSTATAVMILRCLVRLSWSSAIRCRTLCIS